MELHISRRRKYFKPMLAIQESVETIFLLTSPPSATPILLVKALSTSVFVQIIITNNYHWIIIKVRKTKKSAQEAISRDNFITMRVLMFSIRV